jgi:hypothetical protein
MYMVSQFFYDTSLQAYRVTDLNLIHNHVISKQNVIVHGKQMVNHEIQLSIAEFELIIGLARYSVPGPRIRQIAESQNSGRQYTAELLHRVITKGRAIHLGNDPDSLTKFFEQGYSIRSEGGIFSFEVDVCFQIKNIIVQVKP